VSNWEGPLLFEIEDLIMNAEGNCNIFDNPDLGKNTFSSVESMNSSRNEILDTENQIIFEEGKNEETRNG